MLWHRKECWNLGIVVLFAWKSAFINVLSKYLTVLCHFSSGFDVWHLKPPGNRRSVHVPCRAASAVLVYFYCSQWMDWHFLFNFVTNKLLVSFDSKVMEHIAVKQWQSWNVIQMSLILGFTHVFMSSRRVCQNYSIKKKTKFEVKVGVIVPRLSKLLFL